MEQPAHPLRIPRRRLLSLVAATVLAASACDASVTPTASPTPPPTASPIASAAASPSTAPPDPSPSAAPAGILPVTPGMLAEAVTDSLRVRSQPRVADDSVRYTPLLAKGTQLVVTGGPVQASGYTWYRVAPIGVSLLGGVDQGWVAVADHDGTPWVAPATDPTPGFELAADASLAQKPVDLAAAKAEAKALNDFGLGLYRQLLRDPGRGAGDVVVSPYSIATALGMARAGANGDTASQIDRVLRVSGWAPLGNGLSSLDQLLRSHDASWTDDYGDEATHQLALRTANMAFAQRDYHLESAYLGRIGRAFSSGVGLVDYVQDPDAARQAINGWVSRQTLARIPELLPENSVSAVTRLVLVNAIYLKAEWAHPFDPELTSQRAFRTASGKTVVVPTMELWGDQDIALASGDGWKATQLRYQGADGSTPLAMTLIRPDDMSTFERSLTPAVLSAVQSKIASEERRIGEYHDSKIEDDCGTYDYNVHLFLPRFGIDLHQTLNNDLKAMGMRLAFDAQHADFSGMTTQDRLSVGFVIHQANIDVDEQGTEAAAATAIGMDTGGCTGPSPAATKTFRLDRPFIFLIRDTQTGAILFMGRVMEPAVTGP